MVGETYLWYIYEYDMLIDDTRQPPDSKLPFTEQFASKLPRAK